MYDFFYPRNVRSMCIPPRVAQNIRLNTFFRYFLPQNKLKSKIYGIEDVKLAASVNVLIDRCLYNLISLLYNVKI